MLEEIDKVEKKPTRRSAPVKLTLYLTESLHKNIKASCRRRDISMAGLIRHLLVDWHKKKHKIKREF